MKKPVILEHHSHSDPRIPTRRLVSGRPVSRNEFWDVMDDLVTAGGSLSTVQTETDEGRVHRSRVITFTVT